jgi:hypothetical protein
MVYGIIYLTKKIYDYYNIGMAKNKTKHNNKKRSTTRKNKGKRGGDPDAQQPTNQPGQPSPAQPAHPMSQYWSCWLLPYVQGKCTKKDANGYPGGTEKCSFFDYLGYLIYTDKCFYKAN